jgi:hypothetical protein
MKLAADENFNGAVLRGLKRKLPELDIVRVQDTTLYESADPDVLAWTAEEGRILLTHDVETMPKYAFERVSTGLSMPGIVEVPQDMPVGKAIEQIAMIIGASSAEEWANQVVFLPL